MSDSTLTRHAALAHPISFVAAANLRLASRYANILKCGRPVAVSDLEPCGLILVQAPAEDLPFVADTLRSAGFGWKGRRVALIDDELDAQALAVMRQSRASVCAAALSPPLEHPVLVVEGDEPAVRAVRVWASQAHVRSVALRAGTKQLYSAALTAAGSLLAPVLDGAARGLRSAGLNQADARRILRYVGEHALRAQQAHGRKAWQNPSVPARRDAVCAQLAALDRFDPELAGFQRQMLLASLEFYGFPADWLEHATGPGKARPACAGAHPL